MKNSQHRGKNGTRKTEKRNNRNCITRFNEKKQRFNGKDDKSYLLNLQSIFLFCGLLSGS
jgi:hypothetical protein